ncbi:MAG: MBL fold metallo-hydrolase [Lachnospiraceae bacterium]|nr:MBL fold metallo-hydrolase [Lachnospiraceae bacterium]
MEDMIKSLREKKKAISAVLIVLAVGLLALALILSFPASKSGEKGSHEPGTDGIYKTLEVHFLDVGQGDAALLICGGEAMMIDAGSNDSVDYVKKYLDGQGIKKLKYAVGTHCDSDHVGGLDEILSDFEVETLMVPDQERDTKSYKDVMKNKSKAGKTVIPKVGDTFTLGDATLTVFAPARNDYEESNDYSIVLRLDHGEDSFLFTGDAQEESEKEMLAAGLDVHVDVLKVSHHGSKKSSIRQFLEAVVPQYAVVSCAKDNDYGHPHAPVLKRLRILGVQLFRTDEQGTIVCYSDGHSPAWNKDPSESWQQGRAPEKTEDDGAENKAA